MASYDPSKVQAVIDSLPKIITAVNEFEAVVNEAATGMWDSKSFEERLQIKNKTAYTSLNYDNLKTCLDGYKSKVDSNSSHWR